MAKRGSGGQGPPQQVAQVREGQGLLEAVVPEREAGDGFHEELDRAWGEWERTFDTIHDSIMLLDDQYTVIQANIATSRFFARPLEEIVGRKCCELVHGKSGRPQSCPLQKAMKTKRRQEAEFYLAEKDVWVSVSVDPVRDHQGRISTVVHIIRDITGAKRATEELKRSEQRFRAVFDHTLVGLYRTTPEGRILMANPILVRMLGFSSLEELKRRNLEEEGFGRGCPRSVFKQRMEMVGHVVGLESAWVKKDGTTVFVRENARAVRDAQGKVLYYEGMVLDITERKRAEQALHQSEVKFRGLAEQSPNMIFIKVGGRIVYANRTCQEILGYSVEQLCEPAFDFFDLVAPESRGGAAVSLAEHAEGHGGEPRECVFLAKEGRRIEVLVSTKLIDFEGQKAALAIATDITQRKKTEQSLKRQTRLLNAINTVLTEGIRCESETELARTCLAAAARLTDSEFGFIGEVTSERRLGTIAISDTGWQTCTMMESKAAVALENMPIRGIWGEVIWQGRSLAFNDPRADPASVPLPDGHPPINRFLGVPLRRAGQTIGIIALANKPTDYARADIEAIEALSVSFVEALMRKRAERQREKARRRTARLNQLLETMARAKQDAQLIRDRDGLLESICQRIADHPYKMVWIGFCDEASKHVLPRVWAGSEAGYLQAVKITYDQTEHGQGPTGRAVRTGKPAVMRFISADPLYQPWRAEALKRGYASSAALPLFADDKVVGTLNVYSDKPDAFDDQELRLLEELAHGISMALRGIEHQTRREQAEDALRAHEAKLKSLASELALAEERERRRIAAGIHDDVGQRLALAKLELQSLAGSLSDPRFPEALHSICTKIDEAIERTHSLIFELSNPALYELSFDAALEQWLFEQVQKKHGLKCEVLTEGAAVRLNERMKIFLFQVLRELSVNVVKHASATMLRVRISQLGDGIEAIVEDDGVGFVVSGTAFSPGDSGGFGLFNVRERLEYVGGHMEIESSPGKGTRITLTVPLDGKEQPEVCERR